jgi:hypothetical protein
MPHTAVHVLVPTYLAIIKEGKKLGDFDYLIENAEIHAGSVEVPGRRPKNSTGQDVAASCLY